MTEVDVITPEFEIDVKAKGEETHYRVIDIPRAKIIFEKVIDLPIDTVMERLRVKLKEVVM